MELIMILIGVLMNFFNGKQDLGNSRTELALIDEINRGDYTPVMKKIKKSNAGKNRSYWHRNGLITYGLTGLMFGSFLVEEGLIYAIYFVFIFYALRPLVFNPVVAIGLDQGFFHLSSEPGSWDKFWKDKIGEEGYWFFCLGVCIGFLALYYFKIDFGLQ